MSASGLIRGMTVTLLLVDSIIYAWWLGLWPAVGWLATAVAAAKFLPEDD